MQQGLVPGRIVYFVIPQTTAEHIMLSRVGNPSKAAIRGNPILGGQIVSAHVVRVNEKVPGDRVNLKLELDGADTYWTENVPYDGTLQEDGTYKEGTWHWMFEGQNKRYTPDNVQEASRAPVQQQVPPLQPFAAEAPALTPVPTKIEVVPPAPVAAPIAEAPAAKVAPVPKVHHGTVPVTR